MRYQYRTEVRDVLPDDAWIFTDDGNASYYPAFLFIPYEMLWAGEREFWNIPRCFNDLLRSETGISILQKDYFIYNLSHCYSLMVWQVIHKKYKVHLVRQVFSNDNPIVTISYLVNFWIDGLEKAHILPTKETFLKDPYYRYHKFGYQDMESAVDILTPIVISIIEEYGFDEIIETVKKYPCHEDFSDWGSTAKIDFERKWNHSRAKHKPVSLEQVQQQYAQDYDGAELDFADESYNLEKDVVGSVHAENFLKTLSDKDRAILELRLKERTMKEVADELGYKTHSAVLKRLKKIGIAYQEYSGKYFGLDP